MTTQAVIKPSVREKLKEATILEILNAAEVELAEQGFAATSMNAIAQRAGVAVGTLYNYFRDKNVLLTELVNERKDRFIRSFDEAMAANENLPFTEQLHAIINTVFGVFDTQRNYFKLILAHEIPSSASKSKSSPPAVMQFIDRFRPLVAKGVDSGFLIEQDADLYASVLAALMRSVMIERLTQTERPFSDATPFVIRMFLNGAKKNT